MGEAPGESELESALTARGVDVEALRRESPGMTLAAAAMKEGLLAADDFTARRRTKPPPPPAT